LATQPPHKSLRVLFVDDEESLREFMRTELPGMGHEVVVCGDGRSALKVLEKERFDAAILDLKMPGMTGIELLEHVRILSPETEAVVMTGYASTTTSPRRASSMKSKRS
jgi:CheY-like chemotaxis protein